MSGQVLLVERAADWRPEWAARLPALRVVPVADYLRGRTSDAAEPDAVLYDATTRVINLCRSQRYLSAGYYGSLLAEARGQRVVPTVRSLQDLSRRALYTLDIGDVSRKVARVLGRRRDDLQPTAFELTVFFGQCASREMQEIAQQVFALFPAPLIRIEFRLQGVWQIAAIRPLGLANLRENQHEAFLTALEGYVTAPWRRRRAPRARRYDVALLHDATEALAPSNPGALKRFIRAGRKFGLDVEPIGAKDFGRLAEFDALFIRETTAIDHHTYRFARKAEAEGMVVIDDPDSILRCTNKIYLAERLAAHRIATPKTRVLTAENLLLAEAEIGYPVVLKIPDGSFSRGVFKAENRDELESIAKRLLKESDLILAQEFLYTPFDWRVGVLDRRPLFVSQYFMSRKHWQIVNHEVNGSPRQGGFQTLAVEAAPRAVVQTALKAANLVGDGLYGVDLKQTERGVFVIEVNDNPNLDAGIEDKVLGEALYERVMQEFLRRIEAIKRPLRTP